MDQKEGKGSNTFSQDILRSLGTYLGAAFGFVTGLAWNNAIQALINYYVPNKGNSITTQFIYAIGLTLTVTAGTYIALRIARRDKGEESQETNWWAGGGKKEWIRFRGHVLFLSTSSTPDGVK
ncbi:MAG: DUF5654 family protein [Minisyncoccota bacterium]